MYASHFSLVIEVENHFHEKMSNSWKKCNTHKFLFFFSLFKVSLTSTFLCIISQFKIFPFKHHVLIWFAWLCGHFFRIFLLSPEGDNSENRLENENAIITCNGHDAEAVNSFGFEISLPNKKKEFAKQTAKKIVHPEFLFDLLEMISCKEKFLLIFFFLRK